MAVRRWEEAAGGEEGAPRSCGCLKGRGGTREGIRRRQSCQQLFGETRGGSGAEVGWEREGVGGGLRSPWLRTRTFSGISACSLLDGEGGKVPSVPLEQHGQPEPADIMRNQRYAALTPRRKEGHFGDTFRLKGRGFAVGASGV